MVAFPDRKCKLNIADEQNRFSDNAYDRYAGEEETIIVSNPMGTIKPEMLFIAGR